jgi:hypothetical protein
MSDAPQVEADERCEEDDDDEDVCSGLPEGWVDLYDDPEDDKTDKQATQIDQAALPKREPSPHRESTLERHTAILEPAGIVGVER